jgi:phosphonopyruvate decarboxylase
MISPKIFHDILNQNDVSFYTGIPDSLLKDYCAYITDNVDSESHIIAANEGGAVALAIGFHLATGNLPLVYLQNSGLGNIINPILSLADAEVYSVPMILLIGWRGEPGVKDEPQHIKQGRVQNHLLDAMEIPYIVVGPDEDNLSTKIFDITSLAKQKSKPVAIIVKKDTFSNYKVKTPDLESSLTREEAISSILDSLTNDEVIVSTTGMPSRELYEQRILRENNSNRDFLTVGGMGHCSQIALGISLNSKRNVICIDGDGAVLMHMGSIPIIGQFGNKNFIHIILNNGAHDSVGGQPTIAGKICFRSIATASGYKQVFQIRSSYEVSDTLSKVLNDLNGPILIEIVVKKGNRSDLGRPKSRPEDNKKDLMLFLKNEF